MSVPNILLGLVVLALFVSLPFWPFSRNWGYYPSSAIAFVLMVLIVTDALSRIFI